MFKRFMIGLTLGMASMHWYIHSSDPVVAQVSDWFHGRARNYSDQRAHEAATDIFDSLPSR